MGPWGCVVTAAGSRCGGHHAKEHYGVQVSSVGLMEFVLEKGTVGDLSLVLGMLGQQCWGLLDSFHFC